MKTAMQELIDSIRFTDKECYATMFNEGLFDKALEKEKEQIIEAHKLGWFDCQQHIKTIGETTRQGEEYYNQTYNQKQHIIDIMKADENDGLYK